MKEKDFYYFKDVLFGLRKVYLEYDKIINDELKKYIKIPSKLEDVHFEVSRYTKFRKPKILLIIKKRLNIFSRIYCILKGKITRKNESIILGRLKKEEDRYVIYTNSPSNNVQIEINNCEEFEEKVNSILNLDFSNYMIRSYRLNRDRYLHRDSDTIEIRPNRLDFMFWNNTGDNDESLYCKYNVKDDTIELYISKKNKETVSYCLDYIFNYKVPKIKLPNYICSCIEKGNTFNKRVVILEYIKKGYHKFRIKEDQDQIILSKI